MQKLEQHFMQLNINSSILCIKGRD
jgi:hypothetical protein